MEPVLLIHGYSAEGPDTDNPLQLTANMEQIYGGLPNRLRELGLQIVTIDLSRWLSLDDGLSIEDIAQGLDNALHSEAYKDLLSSGFNIVIHSTGALVVRAWLRRYWVPSTDCPIKRIVHLAGANFGSAIAVVGQSLLAKWFRLHEGTGVGKKVLQALELGSSWTIDLQLEVDRKIEGAGDRGPLEFLAIGSQPSLATLLVPIPALKEDGSDDTVRVPAGNLNYLHVTIESKPDADPNDSQGGVRPAQIEGDSLRMATDSNGHYAYRVETPVRKPFAIVKSTSHVGAPSVSPPFHNDETAIMDGANNHDQMIRLLGTAFRTQRGDMDAAIDAFQTELQLSRDSVDAENEHGSILFQDYSIPQFFDTHAMVIFRVWDQNGTPVKDFSIYFNSHGGGTPEGRFDDLMQDTHKNQVTPNCIVFFMRLNSWDGKQRNDLLTRVNGFMLHVDAKESETNNASYISVEVDVPAEEVPNFIQPDKTTIVDVYLTRKVGPKAFQIVDAPPPVAKSNPG